MALAYKLNVTLWERKPDGDLVSTLRRKFSLPVNGDTDIWSLKALVEAMYLRATNIHLKILELLDGDDCNIEWDAGNLVSQYFVPTAQAAGNDKLYTLKVIRTVNPEEEERRKREGTISGGSFDMSKAVAPPVPLEINGGDQMRRIRGIRDPDQALPSNESDAADGPTIPQTPVSRKRRHGSDHQFRPAPSSRNTSLQILQSQPNIQFAPPGQRHDRSSQSPKSESPSEPGLRNHPELPIVLETEPPTQNATQNDSVATNGVDEALADQPAESERESRNVFSSPGYSRKASKEALRRPSRSRSPRRSKWDLPSQDAPSSRPKRPSALSKSAPRTRNQASRAGLNVNSGHASTSSNNSALELDETLGPKESGVPDLGNGRVTSQRQYTDETSDPRGTSATDNKTNENHGDLINGHALSEDVEDAMNIDVPDLNDYADLIDLPSKSTRAKPTLEVPCSATPRQRANASPSALSPRPSILRKQSIASEAGTSTNSRSSPGGSRRSVSFRADTPSVIGEPVGDPTSVTITTDADSANDHEALLDSESGKERPTQTKVGKKKPAVTDKNEAQLVHDTDATSSDASEDEMEVDTPRPVQTKEAKETKQTAKTTPKATSTTPAPRQTSQKHLAAAGSRLEKETKNSKKSLEKSEVTPDEAPKDDPWAVWRLNIRNGVNLPNSASKATTLVSHAIISAPKVAGKLKTPAKSKAKAKATPAKSKNKLTPAPTASAPKENAALAADREELDSDYETSQAVNKSTRKKPGVNKPSKISTGDNATPARSASKASAAGTAKDSSDTLKKSANARASKSTQQVLGDIDERQRSQSVDPSKIEKSKEPVGPSTQTRSTRSRAKNADLAMVQEMRKKSQSQSQTENSPAEDESENRQTASVPQNIAKKGKKPPGQRNKNAPVLGRPSSKGSDDQKKSKLLESNATPQTRVETKALDVNTTFTAAANRVTGKDEDTGSDAKKIEALSQQPINNGQISLIVTSGEESSDSSDDDDDDESVIPGRAPEAEPSQSAEVEERVAHEHIEETSSDDASDSESDEEDSMTMLAKALTAKADASKSSQSISLTPPISDPTSRPVGSDAPQFQRKPSPKPPSSVPRAFQQFEESAPGQPVRKPATVQAEKTAHHTQTPSDSEDEDLPLPKPSVPAPAIPTQIATFQLESGSSSDDKEYPIPPPRRVNLSQTAIPPMSSQGRVTSQLNAEHLAAVPSSPDPFKSSQFGSVETPTPAPGKGGKSQSNAGLRRSTAAVSRMQSTKATGLSSLIRNRAQSRGMQQSDFSSPGTPAFKEPAQQHDEKKQAVVDDDDDDDDNDDDEDSSESDSDDGQQHESAKKTARGYKDWSNMLQSAKVGK